VIFVAIGTAFFHRSLRLRTTASGDRPANAIHVWSAKTVPVDKRFKAPIILRACKRSEQRRVASIKDIMSDVLKALRKTIR
jgi:hypothetical protein